MAKCIYFEKGNWNLCKRPSNNGGGIRVEFTDNEIHVKCPNCPNKRLFDCGATSEGIIKVKCPSCKEVAEISLQYVSLRYKRKRLAAYKKIAAKNI